MSVQFGDLGGDLDDAVGMVAADAEGIAKDGAAIVHRVRNGEGPLGVELHGAMVVSSAVGEPHIREQLGIEGRAGRSHEPECGCECNEEPKGFKLRFEAAACKRKACKSGCDALPSAGE